MWKQEYINYILYRFYDLRSIYDKFDIENEINNRNW